MRLRVPSAKGDAQKLQEVRQSLSSLPGVSRISGNATIGTMVIEYDRTLFPQFPRQLMEHATGQDIVRIEDALTANLQATESVTDQSIERSAEKLNQTVQKLTGNVINLKELFPFSIVLYAVLFVDRAINAAQWLSWLQFAFSAYFELHQEDPIAKIGASIETLRAEMNAMHAETLKAIEVLTAQMPKKDRG
jgi:hypothetical protein